MATTTTTDLELDEIRGQIAVNDARPANSSTTTKLDDIAEASRIVDAGVPEGGYGWVALAACGILCFWFGAYRCGKSPPRVEICTNCHCELSTVGTTYCWGVIQSALVESGLSSASTLSWIGSLAIACNALLAVISARVLRSLGSQHTAFCGISFLAAGEILAGFSVHNVGGLFVTAGFIM